MSAGKTSFMKWIDARLARDPTLRRQVEEMLAEMRLEQTVAALRADRGISQRELARILGVSQPAIAKLESGRVKNVQLKTLARLAAALGGTLRIEIIKRSRPARIAAR